MTTSATVAGQQRDGSRSFRELPHRQRQVLVLRYYLDQNEAEIADILRVSRGSVKKHASRALAALARCLEAAP